MYRLTAALLLCTASLAEAQLPTWPYTRLRTDNPTLSRLVKQAGEQSPTFRALVEQIHTTNAIVLVQFGRCGNGRFRSCVAHLQGTDQSRFMRIVVDTRTNDRRIMATLAHELQHAMEILSDPTAKTADDVARVMLGRAMGDCGQGTSTVCETEAALDVEAKVYAELEQP